MILRLNVLRLATEGEAGKMFNCICSAELTTNYMVCDMVLQPYSSKSFLERPTEMVEHLISLSYERIKRFSTTQVMCVKANFGNYAAAWPGARSYDILTGHRRKCPHVINLRNRLLPFFSLSPPPQFFFKEKIV